MMVQESNTPASTELAQLRQQVAELRASKAQLEQTIVEMDYVLDQSPVLRCIAGLDGYYKRVNPAFQKILGWSEEESLSRPFIDFIHPEDRASAVNHLAKLAVGEILVDFTDRNICKDGTHRCFSWTVVPLPDKGIMHGIGHDITARKQAEETLSGLLGELENRVQKRTEQLTETNQALQREVNERTRAQDLLKREHRVLRQMLKAQDRERQMIAYEIHDGLTQELTGAIMQFQAYRPLTADNEVDASQAFDAGVATLHRALSEARRLISGLRPPILDESGIVAALGHLIHEVRKQEGPDVEFHSRVAFDRLEPILENALYRIVQESLTNAMRYSKSERVKIRLLEQADYVRVEIQDYGIGFDPSKVDEACFGLEGIHERARVFGGQATVKSAPGKGTRVTVDLPLGLGDVDAESSDK